MSMHQDIEAEAASREVVAKCQLASARRIAEIDTGIQRSRLRQKGYEATGDPRSAEIEESVQDRLLRERFEVTTHA